MTPIADSRDTRRADLAYVRAALRAPMLTREREFELARRWRQTGDQTALHELVQAYAKLVVATARRFRAYGLPPGDLVQEGNLGLLQAAARFEPERDIRFSTYATWWIRAQMQDFVLRNWSIVRTGTTSAQKTLFFNLRRLRARLGDGASARLTPEHRDEVARRLGVAPREVEEMEGRLAGADHSLNAGLGDEDETAWQDRLVDDRPDPEQAAMAGHDAGARLRLLAQALAELAPRDREIVRARHLTEAGATLEVLGRRFGVSKERVRQLERRALDRLRAAIARRVADPAEYLPAA